MTFDPLTLKIAYSVTAGVLVAAAVVLHVRRSRVKTASVFSSERPDWPKVRSRTGFFHRHLACGECHWVHPDSTARAHSGVYLDPSEYGHRELLEIEVCPLCGAPVKTYTMRRLCDHAWSEAAQDYVTVWDTVRWEYRDEETGELKPFIGETTE